LLENIEDIYKLKPVNPYSDGILPLFLERMRYFVEETDYMIPVSCLDMNGPMAVAMDIIGSEQLLLGMYEYPDEIKYLLNFVMDNIMLVTEACIEAAGGMDNITCTDFCDIWFPEGRKGHVSDDVSAMYKPEMFKEFSIPVNNRIYGKYGPGLLHNCGPNPCVEYYLEHTPNINGVDLAYNCSRDDLPKFRKPFKRKGVIYLTMGYSSHEETLGEYRYIIESLAPDVIAILRIHIDDKLVEAGKCDVGKLYNDLLKMSTEYADRMW
jgi:uroporphyrinogen-III decarboxylase